VPQVVVHVTSTLAQGDQPNPLQRLMFLKLIFFILLIFHFILRYT